jgi:hypothetical protein
MTQLLRRTWIALFACALPMLGNATAMYAQEVQPLPRMAPIGVVNRHIPEAVSEDGLYLSASAWENADTLRAVIFDVRESAARKKHAVIGAVTGGVVGGVLGVLFTNGCSAQGVGAPSCAVGQVLVVSVSTAVGVVVGAVGGYFWPVGTGP